MRRLSGQDDGFLLLELPEIRQLVGAFDQPALYYPWLHPDRRVDDLYQLLKSRQLAAAQAALAGEPGEQEGIEFVEDIYDPFYGGRQFSIRDPNGYVLYFMQLAER